MAKKLYGTDPDQVPTNADLGTMAYQDAENPRLNNVVISGSPNDDAYGTLLRVKRGPSESGTWATVAIEAQTANGNSRIAFVNDIEPSPNDAHGMIDFEHQYNRMYFFVDGSEAAHFNASGNLVFPNGQGIDFSASQGSGASSSILDDYEEGTWTPVVRGSSTAGSYTITTSGTARYVKVGNLATVSASINNITQVTAGSGYLQIAGLPYNKPAATYASGSVGVSNGNLGFTPASVQVEFISTSGTSNTVYVYCHRDNATSINFQIDDIVSGTTDIRFTITYKTS